MHSHSHSHSQASARTAAEEGARAALLAICASDEERRRAAERAGAPAKWLVLPAGEGGEGSAETGTAPQSA